MINAELFKNVPADCFADRWLLWTWGPKGANGKRRKIPCKVDETFHTLDAADAHKDDGQMSLSDALKAAAGFPNKVAGIGYCLRAEDELLFVDCDGCFDESGNLTQTCNAWLICRNRALSKRACQETAFI